VRLKRFCENFASSLMLVATLSLIQSPARSVQVASSPNFVQVPQLVGIKSFEKGTGSLIATYYLTVTVPAQAGVPLQRLTLTQSQGTSPIQFIAEQTKAYQSQNRQAQVGVKLIQQDLASRTTAIAFEPAIAPGQTVTIALRPTMNPAIAGTYQFGVTAFPEGDQVRGQFLGVARLQFYNRGGRGQG
jgi:Protein of unknown function (DUF2808)